MSQSKVKKMIVILGIITLFIIILMVGLTLFQKEEERQETKEILDKGNITPTTYEKKIVTDHAVFFTVADCIQKYLNSISLDVETITSTPVAGSKMRSAATIYAENQGITDEKSKRQAIYNFLDTSYKEAQQITIDNILDKIEVKEAVEFTPLKMYEKMGETITQYAVYGKIQPVNEGEEEREVYYLVKVDKKSKAFAIIPVAHDQYDEVEEIPLKQEETSIQTNQNNVYSYRIMPENEIAQKYFTYYKKLMQTNSKEAYDLLDEEYRNKRFGNLEEFEAYLTNSKEERKEYVAKEYKLNQQDGVSEYICQDQYCHYYIFEVTAVMQFSVKLDNYTIETEEIKQEYQMAEDKRKVEMNVDKWILMLNYRDYKSAYEVLDETFREKYFKTVDAFETYMRKTFPIYYGLNLSTFSKQSGVYIQKILLTDIRAKKDMVLPETIIMKLTEDGFKMSFRIID